ncbi:MAG: gamma-glutamyl-gamma-aminobutyrate hydrolase family protein [Gammaproteobacteria bacterium]|nr:gamma-glutamyl-gamma-aminobutyrate hydrolase family protein [Gammaproteobacteria bacterium]
MHTPHRRPIVGIPADRKDFGGLPFHAVGEKYVLAVHDAAKCTPLLMPSLGDALDYPQLLGDLDGILLTGSRSNIEPRHYAGAGSEPGTAHDPHRDATTLALIPKALAAGVPILAICRGFQEMNVALGGTLHQKVHEQADRNDHREDESRPIAERYEPVHEVTLNRRGLLARLAVTTTVKVNSLHAQGVEQLAPGLEVEAIAPDGLIEAFSVRDARAFALAVQWHPEWRVLENPFYAATFHAFGDACRQRAMTRHGQGRLVAAAVGGDEALAGNEGC